MLVSLKWLADYVSLPSSPKELAARLTIAGVKVERIITSGSEWDDIAVGQVLAVDPHPNADRLSLVTVDVGGAETSRVVCGAPNVAVGQKIAFGAVGARVFDGHTGKLEVLKPAKIRGVDSSGMVLSEKELGLSDEHTGILVLSDAAPVGVPLRDHLGDTIFDLEITPNRPDLLSVLGVAWEAAAQARSKVQEPERVYPETSNVTAASRTSVTIEDRDLCSRYIAGIVERVKIGPSPEWMQERLRSAGMRPINNVVDITNYIMLEYGQPLHAFDYRKLAGGKIIVRRARPGETMTTLDGVERKLAREMLVIADDKRPVAIAGVMGGSDAEVTDATTMILLESACFNPVSIRATSTTLGLRTEASVRFEKGLHPELANVAARRAMKLLVEVAGGRAAKGLVDTYAVKRTDTRVVVSKERIHQVLGVELTPALVRNTLSDLGFGCRHMPPDAYVVRVPYWRTDVTIPDDVVEELARVTGYDRIESMSLRGGIPTLEHDRLRAARERLRNAAVAAGLQEIITYPLTNTDTLSAVVSAEELSFRPPPRLENPMSSEQVVMRSSLRASLLSAVAANLRWQKGVVAVFESARVFLSREGDLPEEREHLTAAVAGKRPGRWGEPLQENVDFFDAKGLLEDLLSRAGLAVEFQPHAEHGLLKGRTALFSAASEPVGVIGQAHPQTAARFGIEGPAFIFDIDVEAALGALPERVKALAPSRFPVVMQDLAFVVDRPVPARKVQQLIESNSLVAEARLFDTYEGPPLPEGKRSLAFAVHFQAPDRTLTDAEVADARRRIERRLERELGAELRGGERGGEQL